MHGTATGKARGDGGRPVAVGSSPEAIAAMQNLIGELRLGHGGSPASAPDLDDVGIALHVETRNGARHVIVRAHVDGAGMPKEFVPASSLVPLLGGEAIENLRKAAASARKGMDLRNDNVLDDVDNSRELTLRYRPSLKPTMGI